MLAVRLNGRAWHRAIGAVNTAVTWLGPENRAAVVAFVQPLAGVDRHGLGFDVAAFRASQCRLGNHGSHFEFSDGADG